jgi:PAS domain S-box-containing protein
MLTSWQGMALVVAIAGLIAAASVRRDLDALISTEFQALEQQALLAEYQIGGVLRGLNVGLRGLAADQEADPPLPTQAISQQQLVFLKEFPEVRTITATDETGRVTAAESIQTPQDLDVIRAFSVAERDFFRFHRDARAADLDRVYLSRPFIGVSKRWIIVASRAIRGSDGEFRGCVVATLSPTLFEPVFRDILTNPVVDAAAVHTREGDIVYRLPDADQHTGRNVANGQAFQLYLRSDSNITRYLGMTVTDKQKRMVVFGKLGDSGLDVAISARYDRVVAKWVPAAAGKAVLFALFVVLALALGKALRRRHAAGIALSQSESRFRALFEASPNAILLADPEWQRLSDVNPVASTLLGYSRSELLAMRAAELFRTEDRERAMARLKRAIEGRADFARDLSVLHKDGHAVPIDIAFTHLQLEGRQALAATFIDLSERKRAERALAEREALLDTTSRISHTGGWEFDPATGQGTWTTETARIHDLPDDEPTDVAKGLDFYCEEYRETIRAAVRDLVDKARPYDLELELMSAKGRRKWVRTIGEPVVENGKVIRANGVIQDITEQKAAQAALRASESRYQSVLDHAADAIFVIDQQGRHLYVNQQASRLLGYTVDELRRMSVAETTAAGDAQHAASTFATLVDTGSATTELRLRRQDGSMVPVELNAILLPDGTIYGACRDITQRKCNEAELERYRLRLEERVASRTADLDRANRELVAARDAAQAASVAKSAFLANMSHEIRTPMNAILGMANLLRRSGLSPEQADRLDKIDTASEHLLHVINDILDLSKIEAGSLVLEDIPLSIDGLLSNVASIASASAQARRIRLALESDVFPADLHGDPTRLQQAVLNYVSNAIKFTENGTVSLRAIKLEESPESARVRFEVEDSGLGIAAEALPRLFTAFEQADNSTTRRYGGTGLGLVITRRLAELMGGEAGVTSTPGVGSTFWFTALLKRTELRDTHAPALATDAEASIQQRHRGSRILLVDDEPVNLEVARCLLESSGLQVDTAEDGFEAIDRAQATAYAVILMDMQMPRLDGLEATRRIRALPDRRDTPILAMTANAFTEDRTRCLAAGMNDFLIKPFVPELLFSTLLNHLERGSEPEAQASQ